MKQILQTLKSKNYINNINIILNSPICSNKLKLEFAYYCAKDLDKYYDNKKYSKIYETRQKCLELLADYILEPKDGKIKDLKYAANAAANAAAYAAANAAAYAAYAAAYAAYAANAAAYAANAAAAYADADVCSLKDLYFWLFKKVTKDLKLSTIETLYS